MLTNNIKFNNFKKKFNKASLKKKLNNFKKQNLLKQYPLLKSFSKNYKYSYSKKQLLKLKKYQNYNLIGMGGSILGAEAIHQFLIKRVKKKFNFINNLEPRVNAQKKSVNIIISKSGETLETISNLHVLQKKNNSNKNIFITENKDSYLMKIAKKFESEIFEHKNFIGGRYSVLSEVGMLPAELMGLNEKKFKKFDKLVNNKKFLEYLILNVDFTIQLLRKGYTNSIILNYDTNSDNLFKWYQQLIAESLGKKSRGILPIISTMPKDNHSLLQLYLDGPKNSFFTFFENINEKSDYITPKNVLFEKKYLRAKKLKNIVNAQKIATQKIFRKRKIPFRSFEILQKDENSLGELFCFFVLETILLGKALKVNPFDQPSVELIKIETKKILS